MTDRVVIYTPLEDILYNQGGFMIVLAVVIAGLIGAGVYALIERNTDRYRRITGTRGLVRETFLRRYNGWISTAAALGALYVIHLANVRGVF